MLSDNHNKFTINGVNLIGDKDDEFNFYPLPVKIGLIFLRIWNKFIVIFFKINTRFLTYISMKVYIWLSQLNYVWLESIKSMKVYIWLSQLNYVWLESIKSINTTIAIYW
jgi:hypothetical protein